jgi:hypothetical protein
LAGFAINPPFTIEMLQRRGPGVNSPLGFNSLLVFVAANAAGGVNHFKAIDRLEMDRLQKTGS